MCCEGLAEATVAASPGNHEYEQCPHIKSRGQKGFPVEARQLPWQSGHLPPIGRGDKKVELQALASSAGLGEVVP